MALPNMLHAVLLGAGLASTVSAELPGPPPPHAPCPPACLWDEHFRVCGQTSRLGNGTTVGTCPQALVFSVGFDSDMVLQRAPAKAAVYGQLFQAGARDQAVEAPSVAVTISEYAALSALLAAARAAARMCHTDRNPLFHGHAPRLLSADRAGGSSYTIQAEVAPTSTYSLPGGAANYSASWKAYLKPAAAGGEYRITAVCTGCGVSVARSTATIHRATFGDVYFCSGSRHLLQSCVSGSQSPSLAPKLRVTPVFDILSLCGRYPKAATQQETHTEPQKPVIKLLLWHRAI
jgi:hypothetical protein